MFHEEELDFIVSNWDHKQLDDYIMSLEARVVATRAFVTKLKQIRRRKSKKSTLDTGVRGGK